MGKVNVINLQKKKKKKICYCLGGKYKTWEGGGGNFSPLKGLKKQTNTDLECNLSNMDTMKF